VAVTVLRLAAASLVAFGLATSAQAQLRIEIAPAFGGYVPTRPLPNTYVIVGCAPYTCDYQPPPPQDLQQASVGAAGGRIAIWFDRRNAVEASFLYAPSYATDPNFGDYASGVTLAALRYVSRVARDLPDLSLLLMAGPAIVHRSAESWGTSPALALGVGIDALPKSRIGLRAEVSDYLYTVHFKPPSNVTLAEGVVFSDARPFQQDLIISLALSLRLGSR
jgi:hypothetical protein